MFLPCRPRGRPDYSAWVARVAFSTVEDTLKNLEQVHHRRKALIYVSDGYDFAPFANARLGLMDPSSPFAQNQLAQSQNAAQAQAAQNDGTDPVDPTRDTQGLKQNESSPMLIWRASCDPLTANRANVTIHTMDPRGRSGPPTWTNLTRSNGGIHPQVAIACVIANVTDVNQNDFGKASGGSTPR